MPVVPTSKLTALDGMPSDAESEMTTLYEIASVRLGCGSPAHLPTGFLGMGGGGRTEERSLQQWNSV
eukprot:2755421-Amphidinium_carterae.1